MKASLNLFKQVICLFAFTLIAPHFVKALPLEVVMRSFQEHYQLVYHTSSSDSNNGAYPWPARTSDNANPGNYPPDGFYGPDQAQSIVNAMFSAMFTSGPLIGYFTPLKYDEIEGKQTIPLYNSANILDNDSPDSNADYITKFSQIARALCKLQVAVLSATTTQEALKYSRADAYTYYGTHNGPSNTAAGVRGAAQDWWPMNQPSGTYGYGSTYFEGCYMVSGPGFDFNSYEWGYYSGYSGTSAGAQAWTECSYGDFFCAQVSLEGRIERGLYFTGGSAAWYIKTGAISGNGVGKTSPVMADNLWHNFQDAQPGFPSASDYLGNLEEPFGAQEPQNVTDYYDTVETGWQVNDQVAVVSPQWQYVLDQKYGFTAECAYCSACSSSACSASSLNTNVNSLDVSVGLGHTLNGNYSGLLKLSARYPSINLSTPTALSYPGQSDFHAIKDSNGWLRQVLSLQALADIVAVNNYKYQINFYSYANRGSADASGVYHPGGTPYATVTVENPDASATIYNRLRITRSAGGPADVRDFVYNQASDQWALITGGGARQESLSTNWDATGTIRTSVRIVTDAQQHVISKQQDTFQVFPFGEQQVSSVVDPDGAALTTTWSYYTNQSTDGNSYGHLKQIVQPTGYWERYEYNSTGRPSKTVAEYLDAPVGAAEGSSRVTTTTYSASNPVETRVQTLLGQEVSRHYVAHLANEAVADIQCTVAGAVWNASTNLVTTTQRYIGGAFSGELQSVSRPDGTLTTYAYSLSGGVKSTVVNTGAPNAGGTAVVDGTSTSGAVDASGNALTATTNDIASGLLLTSASTTQNDDFGRPTKIVYEDGSMELFDYACCGLDSHTDRDGVATTYAYDALNRLQTETRGGITTLYGYDAAGHRTSTVRQGSDGTQIILESTAYDVAGRQISKTDAINKSTGYAEVFDSSGHRVETTTYPDSLGTQVETYAHDGSLLGVGGSAAHPLAYAYGVDAAGVWRQEIRLGSSGETTEWAKTYMDLASRAYKTIYANSGIEQIYFNNLGQLVQQVDPDGVTTLFAYNAKGEQETTAVDMDRNGVIDYAGADRITRVHRSVVSDHGGTSVLRTATTVWATVGADAPQVIQIDDTTPSGKKRWQTSYGLTSQGITACDGAGTCTTTATAPDGAYTVAVTQNGRLSSQTRYDSSGQQLSATTFHYDAHGRQDKQTDARTGDTTFGYYNNDHLQTSVHAGLTTSYVYDAAGRKKIQTIPGGGQITSDYWLTGELKSTSGAMTYTQAYTYDAQGRRKTLTTNGSTGNATTIWNYDAQSGQLVSKGYADGHGPSYAQTVAGRPKTRTWARGIIATYGYNNAGAVQSITYSDGSTPPVSYTYDRMGRVATTTGGSGTSRTLSYQGLTPLLAGDAATSGPISGFPVLTGYDSLLRRSSLQVMQGSTSLLTQGFGFDAASRFKTASQGAASATYGYLPNSGSDFVQNIVFSRSGSNVMNTVKSYNPQLDRLEGIASSVAATTVASFGYGYNAAQQRNSVGLADGSNWTYGYDGLGQLTSASRKWADSSQVAGQQFAYNFDGIGNRTSTTTNGRAANYTPNLLNQYVQRDVPGVVDMLGQADPHAKVTVNDQATIRQGGSYFYQALTTDNSQAAVAQAVDVAAVRRDAGSNSENIVSEQTGHIFVPKTPEVFSYDLDGNLTGDGHWTYTWDAENRLVGMEALTTMPVAAKARLEFAYDDQGRRVQKKIYSWNGSGYQVANTARFLYDGWNLVAEIGNNGSLLHSYLWGLDMSLNLQGAGGVGGLLAFTDNSVAPSGDTHFVCYDGNGNVAALVKALDGSISAQYDYGAEGELIKAVGVVARANPLRFATKYTDEETNLSNYGLRFYNPMLGRWINRDPLEENGGMQLYAMVQNASINTVDYLGMIDVTLLPGIERSKGWLNGAALMDYWFAGSGASNKTTIVMDSWVLKFARAKTVYDGIFTDKAYINDKAKAQIIALAKKQGVYAKGGPFGSVDGDVETLDKDYIQFRVAGALSDPYDDMYAALGRFTFRVVVQGNVSLISSKHCFTISKVGVYVRDSYDFVGDQFLGYWNATTNYVGLNPFKGDPVHNSDFRDYTKRTGKGKDFLVFSDVKVTTLNPEESFTEP